jgi:hypothetical protein
MRICWSATFSSTGAEGHQPLQRHSQSQSQQCPALQQNNLRQQQHRRQQGRMQQHRKMQQSLLQGLQNSN